MLKRSSYIFTAAHTLHVHTAKIARTLSIYMLIITYY